MPLALNAIRVVGDEAGHVRAALGEALSAHGPDLADDGRIAVVVSPPETRSADARQAVAVGAHVFVAWPPGSIAEAESLLHRAEEARVEVGVEPPLSLTGASPEAVRRAGPSRLVIVSATLGPSVPWSRRLAGVLGLCARLAGSREATRVDTEADRDGVSLRAVAASVRFRNGAFAHVFVQAATPDVPEQVTVYASGAETTAVPAGDALPEEVVAFAEAVGAGRPAPYSLDDALAAMRLTERVLTGLR